MSTVLICSSAAASMGDINPLTNVGQWLKQSGHEVDWLFFGSETGNVNHHARVSAFARSISYVTDFSDEEWTDIGDISSLFRDLVAFGKFFYKYIALTPPMVERTRSILQTVQPDVVVCPGNNWVGRIAAHLEAIKFAAIGTGLRILEPPSYESPERTTFAPQMKWLKEIIKGYGVDPDFRSDELVSPWLNIVFTTREAAGRGATIGDDCQLVGPSLPPSLRGDELEFPWEQLRSGAPIVYISFGSIFVDRSVFKLVAQALSDEDVQVVVNGGIHAAEMAADWPPETIIRAYVPQPELLKRASVFVTHGGANSVTEALMCGVPMLILPQWLDQFLQAHLIEAEGEMAAGIALREQALSVQALRSALRALLAPDGSYASNARRISRSFRDLNGGRKAAELIAELARS